MKIENEPTNISRTKTLRRGLTWYISYLKQFRLAQIEGDPDAKDSDESEEYHKKEIANCLEIIAEADTLLVHMLRELQEEEIFTEMFWAKNIDNIFKSNNQKD